MTSGGCEVDVGGGGGTFVFDLRSQEYSTCKKLALGFIAHIFVVGHLDHLVLARSHISPTICKPLLIHSV